MDEVPSIFLEASLNPGCDRSGSYLRGWGGAVKIEDVEK
jgi:hypothetical protein